MKQLLTLSILAFGFFFSLSSQDDQLKDNILRERINEHRKGEIIVLAPPGSTIEIKQLDHEFWFGAALSNSIFDGTASVEDIQKYKEVFLEDFNSAVTENAVKWGNMERRKGEVNYSVVNAMLEWTEENDIPLRGHNIFWGIPKFVQPWVKELSDEELEQALKNRAETLAARYNGRIAEYDLNNEMIHGNYYEDRLGPGITKKMAEWAQNGDPGIELYLNDYDILTGKKLNEYMAHIRELLSEGVPIAGIGVQGHLHAKSFDREELQRSLDSLAVFGLPVKITEFNMPGQRSIYYLNKNKEMTAADEAQKAKDLVDYYTFCFAHPAVEAILMWGFWEGANWIPASSLYNKDWSPTPAAIAYKQLIYNDWWVEETGTIAEDGKYILPAFYGKYEVKVNDETREVNLKKEEGRVEVRF